MSHHVVIVGGGFGGLEVATDLGTHECGCHSDRPAQLSPLSTLVVPGGHRRTVGRQHRHTPLRSILARYENVRVLLAEVSDFDVPGKAVIFADGTHANYDTLVLATGASHSYFGHEEWAELGARFEDD